MIEERFELISSNYDELSDMECFTFEQEKAIENQNRYGGELLSLLVERFNITQEKLMAMVSVGDVRMWMISQGISALDIEILQECYESVRNHEAVVNDWSIVIAKEKERIDGRLTFVNLDEAAAVVQRLHDEYSNTTLYGCAMEALYRLAPEEIKNKMTQKLFELYPALNATHTDRDGRLYFSSDSVCDALGVEEEGFEGLVCEAEEEIWGADGIVPLSFH